MQVLTLSFNGAKGSKGGMSYQMTMFTGTLRRIDSPIEADWYCRVTKGGERMWKGWLVPVVERR
jgi:hypothetical protein